MGNKLTYEQVKCFIEDESNSGCKLLSKEYISNSSPLLILCSCGNEFKVSYNAFSHKTKSKRKCNECSKKIKHERVYPKERIELIIHLYTKENKKMSEISKIVGAKVEYISKILKKYNIDIKQTSDYYTPQQLATTKKYIFNEDFFENINSELKAYWLGFLYADGNVYIPNYKQNKSKGGRIEIALKANDDYHLYNFISDINGNMELKYRDIKLNDNIYKSCRLYLGSIKMVTDLIKHGCIPNKSLLLKFPKHLDNNLYPHFIRGYFDGDGCVAFNIYEFNDNLNLNVLGTYEFLAELKNILENNNIKCSNIKPSKSKAFTLFIFGRDNIANFYNYVYGDGTRFLERKRELLRQALIYFKKDFIISDVAKLFTLFDEDLRRKIEYHEIGRKIRKELKKDGFDLVNFNELNINIKPN